MKSPLLSLALLCAVLIPTSHAQFNMGDGDRLGNNPHLNKSTKEKKPKKVRSVKEALEQMDIFNGEANENAQYFIFLRSASWCGPCQKEMPEIVKIYDDIKASKKVELILWGADSDQAAAQKFLDQHKATFPATMDASMLTEMTGSSGIPSAYVVDRKGKLLYRGHGSLVKNWRYATLDYRKNKKEITEYMKGLQQPAKSTSTGSSR